MPFEGLLAKLGPTLVREAAPHLVQLVSGFTERFRKDNREMKEAVDAEIASLGRAQAQLHTSLAGQGDAIESLRLQVNAVEHKIDRLLVGQAESVRQINELQQYVQSAKRTTPGLLYAVFAVSLMAFGVSVGLLILHK